MEPTSNQTETNQDEIRIDSWEAAFAALEPKSEEAPAPAPDGAQQPPADTEGDLGKQELPVVPETGNADAPEVPVGGLGAPAGGDANQSGSAFDGALGVSPEQIEQYRKSFNDNIRERAIREVAKEFVNRGARHDKQGALGATLDDPDICKRDEDGVPHFYNPETKQEFRGDNPRAQAQEWVDAYNKELARVFNSTCQRYEARLAEDGAPALAVLEFAPTYEKLDPVRKNLFENVIQDYEIKNQSGQIIGYRCDLNQALALVNRQIASIQEYAKQQRAKEAPTGPALDMKTSSGAVQAGTKAEPKSLAEAMEMLQNEQLAKLKK